jgi:hypothetical protein
MPWWRPEPCYPPRSASVRVRWHGAANLPPSFSRPPLTFSHRHALWPRSPPRTSANHSTICAIPPAQPKRAARARTRVSTCLTGAFAHALQGSAERRLPRAPASPWLPFRVPPVACGPPLGRSNGACFPGELCRGCFPWLDLGWECHQQCDAHRCGLVRLHASPHALSLPCVDWPTQA